MSAKVTHYSDDTPVRRPRPVRSRSGVPGATTSTVLNVVRELTVEEKRRRAGLFAATAAVRQGWSRDELADVVAALGLT